MQTLAIEELSVLASGDHRPGLPHDPETGANVTTVGTGRDVHVHALTLAATRSGTQRGAASRYRSYERARVDAWNVMLK